MQRTPLDFALVRAPCSHARPDAGLGKDKALLDAAILSGVAGEPI